MNRIMRLRKTKVGTYSIGIPKDIGAELEKDNVSDMKCKKISKTHIEFKEVK